MAKKAKAKPREERSTARRRPGQRDGQMRRRNCSFCRAKIEDVDYKDINQLVRDVATNTNGRVALDVPDYTVVDWQTTYNFSKSLELRLGVKNLFNETPPFTLRDSSGHQVGYDPRYADLMLRTVYLQGSFRF